ncbi:response regulator [Paenibacillus sp. HJGM_3]|uniref:response regulator n=1 Tax=Paenibacillus sp. HJGM_3 TaxID=3379816 RepID=UPI00385E9C1A
MTTPTRILIVDDHDMVRLGLRTYLTMEDDFDVIGEASDGQEAVDRIRRSLNGDGDKPDVILMDLMMPRLDGVEATRQVCQLDPTIKIVLLTSFLEDEKVVQAIEAGAVTYVMKTVAADELAQVIRSTARGFQMMSADVSQALTRGLRQRSVAGREETEGLTAREKEVLLLIADGKANKEISEELHISIKTVKTHVSNLLMKCEVEDRTQLAIYAHRKGWMSDPS